MDTAPRRNPYRHAFAAAAFGLVLLCLLAPAPTEFPFCRPPPDRPVPRDLHVWVWDGEAAYGVEAGRRFFALLDAVPVAGVFLAFTPAEREEFLVRRPQVVRRWLACCHARGIRVDYLLGENTWVDPARRPGLRRARDELARFQAGGAPPERFDALHVDVEPHALPEWADPDRRATLAAGLLDVLREARFPGLPLVADVPFWYASVSHGGGSLLDAVLARTDGVVVMNYRTGAADFLAGAAVAQRRAAAAGKTVRVGVSVEPGLPDGAAWRSWSELVSFLERVRAPLAAEGRFDGFSIQGYRELAALLGIR
ncbi:MAG: hypothetical protein JXQ29_09580 [Planctomycetes bacterium]|nr:hypothetical protein [Planctomycetota bacterium]